MPFGVVSILSPCKDVAFLHGQDPLADKSMGAAARCLVQAVVVCNIGT
jgi:hypothetical protein